MTSTLPEDGLIYDWATAGASAASQPRLAMLDDETLRDGLQSPSVTDPPTDVKIRILHLMNCAARSPTAIFGSRRTARPAP
jgi:2-isopropylmalate synthase